jgi:DNA-binding NarL/FixJ family response regulator
LLVLFHSLLDYSLGNVSKAVILRNIGCARVVFLSVHESIDFTQAAQKCGAAGYVFKSQITRDLVKTLQAGVTPASQNSKTKLVPWR